MTDDDLAALRESANPDVQRLVAEVDRLRGVIARNNERAKAVQDEARRLRLVNARLEGEAAALREAARRPQPDAFSDFFDRAMRGKR